MVTCQNCGEEAIEGAKFCRNCGAELMQEETVENDQTKFCTNCGFKFDKPIKFCPECGTPTSGEAQAANRYVVPNPNKSPGLAAVLSFLIIGLGQVYLGLIKKGIILFILAILSGILMSIMVGVILWLIVWGYAIYDAYNSAQKINECVEVKDTIDFDNLF